MRERLRLRRRGATPPAQEGDDFESGFLQDSLPGLDEGKRGRLRFPLPRRRDRSTPTRSTAAGAGRLGSLKALGGRIGGALSDGAYAVAATAGSIGDSLAIAGHHAARRWFGLSLAVRRRLAAGALLSALVALLWFVILPVAPCWVPAGDRCPPGNDSLALVPDDAAAFLQVNLDQTTEQAEAARDLAGRLPTLAREIIGGRGQSGQVSGGVIETLIGQPLDYANQVLPWSDGELAVAMLPAGTGIEPVLMIEIADRAGAEKFSESLTAGGAEADYEGTTIVEGRDVSVALSEDFVLVGDQGPIRSIVDVIRGESSSLADNAAAETLLESLPENHLLEVWLGPDAASGLLRETAASPFDTFVNSASATGVVASVSIEAGVVDLAVRSELDPEKVETSPGVFAALPGFEPTLTETVGADAFAYLGFGEPAQSLSVLLDRAQADAPGLAAGFEELGETLSREGVDLEGDLLPLLGGEVALSVEPRLAATSGDAVGETPGAPGTAPVPYAGLLADGVEEEEATEVLARLQGPLSSVADPDAGGPSGLPGSVELGGVDAQVLRLSPSVELTYGFVEGRLALATDPDGIRRLTTDRAPLADLDTFEDAVEAFPDRPSALLYVDLAGVIEQLEALGLGTDTAYGAYAQDLRTLEAAALAVSSAEARLDTDLRLIVADPETVEPAPLPIQPPPG